MKSEKSEDEGEEVVRRPARRLKKVVSNDMEDENNGV